MREKTMQETFWEGEFGDAYTGRNISDDILASKIAFLAKALILADLTSSGGGVIEFGCNQGLNLVALHMLFPKLKLTGVEINKTAFDKLSQLDFVYAENKSLYDYKSEQKFTLTMSPGVLIHQNPDMLPAAYRMLYDYSDRYILVSEYYSPTPVQVNYRGNDNVLFKRDFAGEMLDMFSDLKLVDYGFAYHRDLNFPVDDVNYFLLEKK